MHPTSVGSLLGPNRGGRFEDLANYLKAVGFEEKAFIKLLSGHSPSSGEEEVTFLLLRREAG